MRAVRYVLVLALVLAITAPLMAQQKGRKKGQKRRPAAREGFTVVPRHLLEGLELTAEQKEKVEALNKEYGPKLKEARAKMDGIVTDEQRKARMQAIKGAKEAGKKGKELRKAVEAAVQLTDEQKAQMAEVKKAMGPLQREIREKFMALLTPEQKEAIKEKMKKARPEGKKRAAEGKKGRKKKAAEQQ
jgi:Spy/CpxP family protein refolding chaperone